MKFNIATLFIIFCTFSSFTLHSMDVITCRTIAYKVGKIIFFDVVDNKIIIAEEKSKNVDIRNLDDGKLVTTLCHDGGILFVARCNEKIATYSSDGRNYRAIKIWNLDGTCLRTFDPGTDVWELRVHDGKLMIFQPHKIEICDVDSGTILKSFDSDQGIITKALIIDDKFITAEFLTVKIWNFDGKCLGTFRWFSSSSPLIAATKDIIVTVNNHAADSTFAQVWDANNGRFMHNLNGHTADIIQVEIVGDKVITRAMDSTLKVWDGDGNCLYTFDCDVAFRIIEDKIFVPSGDTIFVYNLNKGNLIRTLKSYNLIHSIIAANDKLFASTYSTINVWNLLDHSDKPLITQCCLEELQILKIADNKLLAFSYICDGTLQLWTDPRPDLYRSKFMAFAPALHPHCGNSSPAAVLSPDVMQNIGELMIPKAWASQCPVMIIPLQLGKEQTESKQ